MQRYWWPGYEKQLLGALQRQQNNARFCDTLLQTEGISVPTHSFILAALSSYLSERLSSSPSPPPGQKRQLQLQAVKPQILLKLVGLLYSGEVEVKGSKEKNDLLYAAFLFGITGLVEGQKVGGMKEGEPLRESCGSCRGKNEGRKMQDAQVQAEMAGRRAPGCAVETRSCLSTGTQTVENGQKTRGMSLRHTGKTKRPTGESDTPEDEDVDLSVTMQPQNISPDERSYSSSIPTGAPSNEESALNQSSDSITNPTSTSAWPSDNLFVHTSLNDDSNSLAPQEDSFCLQPSEVGDRAGTEVEDEQANGEMTDKSENTEQPSHINRDKKLGEEKGNLAGMKSLAKMKQMQPMNISIKVKLRRRTKGEVWEVVSMQDSDKTLSVVTSLEQTDLPNRDPSPVQPSPFHKPETPTVQPVGANSPEAPPHPDPTSDTQSVCGECVVSNQNYELQSVSLAQSPGPVEEPDEHLDRLLEDIMMGLNILPNLERDCKDSHHLQMSHDEAPAICQVPVTESEQAQNQTPAAVSAAGCVYYQDYEKQIDHSSTHAAQKQPSISSLSSVQSSDVLIHQLQQHSTVTSMEKRDGTSHQETPLSTSQNHPYLEVHTGSIIPIAFNSGGQTVHYPPFQRPSSQDGQGILEFFPLTGGNGMQFSHSFSLPCMDDLRLPPCLSPLQQFTSTANCQPVFNKSTSHSNDALLRPSHLPSWLTKNSASLRFPLCAMTQSENVLPQDTNQNWSSKQQQKFKSPQNSGTRAESNSESKVDERGTKSAGHQNATEVKSDHDKVKESLTCQQVETKGETVAPKRRKRKCISHPQDASHDSLKVSDGTNEPIKLSICSVRLSSNNVLANQRDVDTFSSNTPKPDELSAVAQSSRKTNREPGNLNTGHARIRTRGFLKKTQHTQGIISLDNYSVLKPKAHQTKIVNKQGVSLNRQTRGRAPKGKLENHPAIKEKKSLSVESEHQIVNNLPKEVEETKAGCKKRRRGRSKVNHVPMKRRMNADVAEENGNSNITPPVRKPGTRPRMVTLKDFQKLIKRRHAKTRKPQERQNIKPNVPAKDVEGEECSRELIVKSDMDINQPQNTASHVVFNATVDENHNLVFNKSSVQSSKAQRDNTYNSSAGESSLFADENDQLFSSNVLREEARLAAEREQPLKNLDEVQNAVDAEVSDTTRQTAINEEGWTHCDAQTLAQQNKMSLDQKLNPLTFEGPCTPLANAVGFKRSGCNQEEAEDDIVDVDTLLYSPDKVCESRKCEIGLLNTNVNQDDEEEEDEIDVIGD